MYRRRGNRSESFESVDAEGEEVKERKKEQTQKPAEEPAVAIPKTTPQIEYDAFAREVSLLVEKMDQYPHVAAAYRLKEWLPKLLAKVTRERDRYLAILTDTRQRSGTQAHVEISELTFYEHGFAEKQHQNVLGEELYKHAIEKLQEIAKEFFHIEAEELRRPAEDESFAEESVAKEMAQFIPPEPPSRWQELGQTVLQRTRQALVAPVMAVRTAIEAAQYVGAMAMAKLLPQSFLEKLWSSADNQESMFQKPGAGFEFLDKWAPVIVEHRTVGQDDRDVSTDYYTGLNRYAQYDKERDGFVKKEDDRKFPRLQSFHQPVSSDIIGSVKDRLRKNRLSRSETLYTMEMKSVPLWTGIVRYEDGSLSTMMRLPASFRVDQATLVPLTADVEFQGTLRECPILYDEQKNLFIDIKEILGIGESPKVSTQLKGNLRIELEYTVLPQGEQPGLSLGWYAQRIQAILSRLLCRRSMKKPALRIYNCRRCFKRR